MSNDRFDNGLTVNFVNAGLVAGTTSTYTTTASTVAAINGKFVTPLTAQTNTASPTTDAVTGVAFLPLAPNQACALVFGLTLLGVIQLVQGPIISTLTGLTTTVGGLLRAPQMPALPNNFVPLGYTIAQTAPSAASWTPGTSSWAASGVTCTTFQNVTDLPDRPQIS